MADITIESGTPEEVAYKLFAHYLDMPDGNDARLELYAKCLSTVNTYRKITADALAA